MSSLNCMPKISLKKAGDVQDSNFPPDLLTLFTKVHASLEPDISNIDSWFAPLKILRCRIPMFTAEKDPS